MMRMKVEELSPYTPSWQHEIVGSVEVVRLLAALSKQVELIASLRLVCQAYAYV